MTGGRIKLAVEKLNIKDFMLTYGDGISDVNISKLEKFYNANTFMGVVTAVRPPARFGRLKLSESRVLQFGEKNQADEGWINGGFFRLSNKIINYIENEHTVFEKEPLEKLSKEGNLGAYIHNGFWQPVDTVREKEILEEKLNKDNLEWFQ
jgi:glucose-1-phosphate cytidylyltransferase